GTMGGLLSPPLSNVGTFEAVRDWPVGAPSATFTSQTTFWSSTRGNLILPQDPRYAWVPIYKRAGDLGATPPVSATYVQMIFIQVQARNTSIFVPGNDFTGTPIANLQPRPVDLVIRPKFQGLGADVVRFFTTSDTTSGSSAYVPPLAPAGVA